jgi:hypothetical protein
MEDDSDDKDGMDEGDDGKDVQEDFMQEDSGGYLKGRSVDLNFKNSHAEQQGEARNP